ncbi:MAG: threonylcarbamoyl-AMP synthase [Bacteroidetes bacterium]|nr:threonylcarbamoyl-AMP synthase [Bacteroidota bacterium]
MTKITGDTDIIVSELLKGNIAALPTETVYGLGANALNEDAVLKIFETKERPAFNPLIVHVYEVDELKKYSSDIPEKVYDLAEIFCPGPLTFVLKKKNIIPDIVTAGNDSVGLRIPSHNLFREVLRSSGLPLAAPSANRSGKISPTTAGEVLSELDGRIDFILDGGKCAVGIESTVISFLNNEIKILRHGIITKEEIEKITGKISDSEDSVPLSPGMLKIHYAPSTPLYKCADPAKAAERTGLKTGILDPGKYSDLREAAFHLFSDLRKLDESGFEMLLYSEAENSGIGVAINDRLKRAGSGEIVFTGNSFKIIYG